jgi:type II secretory pathway component PulF
MKYLTNYKIGFRLFGQVKTANVKADSEQDAIRKLKEAIIKQVVIEKIEKDELANLFNIFGIER